MGRGLFHGQALAQPNMKPCSRAASVVLRYNMVDAAKSFRRQRNGNRGATGLRPRRRAEDQMTAFDRLPPELRAWLREAALPWSPRSCRQIWVKARSEGASPAETIARLERAEAATLAKARPAF